MKRMCEPKENCRKTHPEFQNARRTVSPTAVAATSIVMSKIVSLRVEIVLMTTTALSSPRIQARKRAINDVAQQNGQSTHGNDSGRSRIEFFIKASLTAPSFAAGIRVR